VFLVLSLVWVFVIPTVTTLVLFPFAMDTAAVASFSSSSVWPPVR
jgi:hypothetical protein